MLGRASLGPNRGPRSRTGSIAPQGFRRTNDATDAIRTNILGYGAIYVSSVTGYNGNSGGTWQSAKENFTGVTGVDWPGCSIYVDNAHAESTASALTLQFAGTVGAPTNILCVVRDASMPPTTTAITGSAATTGGNSNFTIRGCFYVYGMIFSVGSGSGVSVMSLGATTNRQVYDTCKLRVVDTGSTCYIGTTPGLASIELILLNTTLRFAAVSQNFRPQDNTNWWGGGLESGGTAISALMRPASSPSGAVVDIAGCDLSSGTSAMNILSNVSVNSGQLYRLRNCKLPAAWTGLLFSVTNVSPAKRIVMDNCDSGDTNYGKWEEDAYGSLKSETTIVRTGGASDGTTPLSWKITTSANTSYLGGMFYSSERAQWNELVGGSKTLTLEIVHNSQGSGTAGRFTDAEVWLEVMSLSTSGFPLGTWITDAKAGPLAVAVDQADSVVAWTTTGLTTPLKQSLSVTVTPQEKGHFIYRIVATKTSVTLYADPLLTVT